MTSAAVGVEEEESLVVANTTGPEPSNRSARLGDGIVALIVAVALTVNTEPCSTRNVRWRRPPAACPDTAAADDDDDNADDGNDDAPLVASTRPARPCVNFGSTSSVKSDKLVCTRGYIEELRGR